MFAPLRDGGLLHERAPVRGYSHSPLLILCFGALSLPWCIVAAALVK